MCDGLPMPAIITSLVVQKKNKDRVNVFLDGEFAFGLAMIEALKLRKGQALTEQEIDRLKALDDIEVAHERALNFLSYRPRSIAEVRRNLKDKEFSPETIDTVVQRLQDSQLLDDQAFARYWVDNREMFEPRSARALRFELRKKGLGDLDIAPAVEEINEEDAAYRAAVALARRHGKLDWEAFRKKLGDFLLRRGFPYPIIRDVVKRLWREYGLNDGQESGADLSEGG
jgi:regulatory protein